MKTTVTIDWEVVSRIGVVCALAAFAVALLVAPRWVTHADQESLYVYVGLGGLILGAVLGATTIGVLWAMEK